MDIEWFKARKSELKITDTALAKALGVERSVANKVVNGRVAMNARRADAVAVLFGVNRDEILFRAGISEARPAPDHSPTRSADAGETASVQRLDLSYAMGPGTDLDASHVDGESVQFDIAFLRTLTPSPPNRLRIVNGIGDSMMPTVHDREELIIDLNQTKLNMQDRIWAISLFGAGALKRLRTIGRDRVLVISDNPDVGNQEVDAKDIVIAGRLVGSIKRY